MFVAPNQQQVRDHVQALVEQLRGRENEFMTGGAMVPMPAKNGAELQAALRLFHANGWRYQREETQLRFSAPLGALTLDHILSQV